MPLSARTWAGTWACSKGYDELPALVLSLSGCAVGDETQDEGSSGDGDQWRHTRPPPLAQRRRVDRTIGRRIPRVDEHPKRRSHPHTIVRRSISQVDLRQPPVGEPN